jgi:hypothetical protein
MSYTIYKSTDDLIAQAGRTVSTFASGLVRVEQTYLGLTDRAALHRAVLAIGNDMPDGDSSPCIDGLKIFPEVQEVRREDGFTEYQVCAYGRLNVTGKVDSNFQAGSFFQRSITTGAVNATDTRVSCLNEIVVFSKTVLPGAFPDTKLPGGLTLRIWVAANEEQAERLDVEVGDYVLLEQAYPPGPLYETIPAVISGGTVITPERTRATTHEVTILPDFVSNDSTRYGSFEEKILVLRASGFVIRSTVIE